MRAGSYCRNRRNWRRRRRSGCYWRRRTKSGGRKRRSWRLRARDLHCRWRSWRMRASRCRTCNWCRRPGSCGCRAYRLLLQVACSIFVCTLSSGRCSGLILLSIFRFGISLFHFCPIVFNLLRFELVLVMRAYLLKCIRLAVDGIDPPLRRHRK